MILVDTSIWIRLLHDPTLGNRFGERILECTTCPPVIQELFQGLRDEPRAQVIRDGMLALPRVADPVKLDTFLAAADLFRLGRRKGLTIRSSYDCLIAAIAIEHQCAVWHHDRDFEHIASYTALRLIRPA